MEVVGVLIIIAILVLFGLAGYTLYAFYTYKKESTDRAEENRRTALANSKYIIDLSNSRFGTLNSNVSATTATADTLKAGFANWRDDLGSILQLSSNAPGAAGAAGGAGFRLGERPGAPIASLSLMKHTSILSGMTAKDLNAGDNAVLLCGKGENSKRCLAFPNAEGATYLTGLTPGAGIHLDANTKLSGALTLDNGAVIRKLGSEGSGAASDLSGIVISSKDDASSAFLGNNGMSYIGNGNAMAVMTADGVAYLGSGTSAAAVSAAGFAYGSVNSDGQLVPHIKVAAGGSGTSSEGRLSLTSNATPYMDISYDSAAKTVKIDAKDANILVAGDVSLVDSAGRSAGTLSREKDAAGVPKGLKLSGVAGNRLVLDTDVYLPTTRALYGSNLTTLPGGFVF